MDMNSVEIGWNNGYKAAIKHKENKLREYGDAYHYLVEIITSADISEEDKRDMLLYVRELDYRTERLVDTWLDDNEYCIWCGEKLEMDTYKEYHDEIDAYEKLCEVHCPNNCF